MTLPRGTAKARNRGASIVISVEGEVDELTHPAI